MREVLRGKVNNIRGETLAEVLAAILVAALSTALFLGMLSGASQIARDGARADALFYRSVSLLENFETDAEPGEADSVRTKAGTVTVEAEDGSVSQSFEVDIFFGNDMASYRLREGGTP